MPAITHEKTHDEPPLYVQYGCGLCAPARWVNFDASPRLRLERARLFGNLLCIAFRPMFSSNVRYGNITSGLPVPDDSAAGVFCSHVLEHLPRNAVPAALLETKKSVDDARRPVSAGGAGLGMAGASVCGCDAKFGPYSRR
jgi:hypothetical protein